MKADSLVRRNLRGRSKAHVLKRLVLELTASQGDLLLLIFGEIVLWLAELFVRSAKKPGERLRVLDEDFSTQTLPETGMLRGWAREQQIININGQEELCLLDEKARWMAFDRLSPECLDRLREVLFPMST